MPLGPNQRFTVADADVGQARFAAAASLAGTYGSFSFNAGFGVWTYTLNSAAATVQALAAGQTATDTLTVHARDGSATRDIVISIGGANDAARLDYAFRLCVSRSPTAAESTRLLTLLRDLQDPARATATPFVPHRYVR
jgi:VCBS repeat-containing protein